MISSELVNLFPLQFVLDVFAVDPTSVRNKTKDWSNTLDEKSALTRLRVV